MTAVPAPETGPDAGVAWHYGDPFGEQRTAETGAVIIDRSNRAVLTLTGAERKSWLHTICTQHVRDLPDGASTENLTLDGKGHIHNHWVQTELGDVTYLDTEAALGDGLAQHLRKMVFWADVQIAPADLAVLTLLGPAVDSPAVLDALGVAALPDRAGAIALPGGGFLRRPPGAAADRVEVDLLVPRADAADWQRRLTAAGVRPTGVWTYEANRVSAHRPRLGLDTDDRAIPHELNWIGGPGVGAVHLDKGCYSGQETVARVHNLGKPPRMLVLVQLDGSVDRPNPGDPVTAGGRPVGRLGSVVDHFELGPIGLALLKRGLPADTPLATGADGSVGAVIDVDSMPPPDVRGAGRVAVDRLRGRV